MSMVAVEYSLLSISWSENYRLAVAHHVRLLIYGIEKMDGIIMENVKCMYINSFSQMSVRLVNFC